MAVADRDYFRGHKIHNEDGEWLFSDTRERVSTSWQRRPCGYCAATNTLEGYDGCIGRLVGVVNACCGHGQVELAYVQFSTGLLLRGVAAGIIGPAIKACTRKVG